MKTVHKNDFETKVWLWPETRALMNRWKVPQNPHGRWFLSNRGTPMEDRHLSKCWAEKATGLRWKDLRKMGSGWLKDSGGGQEVMRTYRAASFGGIDDEYVNHVSNEAVANLKAGLEKLRVRLLEDGVLEPA